MAEDTIQVLLIEDNEKDAKLIQEELSSSMDTFFNITHEKSLRESLQTIAKENFDVILCDLTLPDSTGLETFQSIQATKNGTPVVILTGIKDENLAMNAVREGAQDYLNKQDIDENTLVRTIKYAIERQKSFNGYFKRRETLRAITENVSDLIVIIDTDGNYKYKSPSFIKMIGEESSFSNQSIYDDIDNKDNAKKLITEALTSFSLIKNELNLIHKNGSTIPVKGTFKAIPNLKGKANEVVLICRLI
ncbi:MAG: response regulator [Candidatus Melainabacteria bacterium]|nr:response regulator [Candidatus Melainabacteria bacterium]